jgi:hypothetical protein
MRILSRIAVAIAALALFPAIGAAQQPSRGGGQGSGTMVRQGQQVRQAARQRPQLTGLQVQQRVDRITERLSILKARQQQLRAGRGQMSGPGQRRAAIRTRQRGQVQIQHLQRQLRLLRRQIR